MGQVLVPDNIAEFGIASTTTLTFPSSIVTVGGQQYKNASAITVNLATTGANGLDTGSLADNTNYYLYAVLSGGSLAVVASTSPETTGPTGFTIWKLVGAFKTQTTASLVDFIYETYRDEGEPLVNVSGKQSRNTLSLAQPVVNLLINGAMDFWQRTNGSVTALLSTVTYPGPDRFYMEKGGGGALVDAERSTDVPNNQFKYSSLITGGEALDTFQIGQRIEAANIRHLIGKTVTFSAYLKVNTIKSLSWNFYTPVGGEDNWVQDNPAFDNEVHSVSFNSQNSVWERSVITFVVPAVAEDGLSIQLTATANLNNGDEIYTTGWMLHEGDTIADFQRAGRNIGEELAMCQRYYHKSTGKAFSNHAVGYVDGASKMQGIFVVPQPLRVTPTVTLSGSLRVDNNGSSDNVDNGSLTIGTGGSLTTSTNIGFSLDVTGTMTVGHGCILTSSNDSDAYVDFDAEI